MSAGEDARDRNPDEVNKNLRQGLKSCRLVINNYRAMLAGDGNAPLASDRAAAEQDLRPSMVDEGSLGQAD